MSEELEVIGVGRVVIATAPMHSNMDGVLEETEKMLMNANNGDYQDLGDFSDTKNLESIYLQHNTKFKELRLHLEKFYHDTRLPVPKLHPQNSAEWRKVLYTSLHKLLAEVVFTSNRKVQLSMLDRVYKWYYQKVGKKLLPEKARQSPVKEENFKDDSDSDFSDSPLEKLNNVQKGRIQSASTARSIRPSTAHTVAAQAQRSVEQSRPVSAKNPGLAFTGMGDPQEKPQVSWSNNYLSYKPLESEVERRMEERYKQLREKRRVDRKIQQDMLLRLNKWSGSKSRQESEFNRKLEGTQFASRFENRGFKAQRPITAQPIMRKGRAEVVNFSGVPNWDFTEKVESYSTSLPVQAPSTQELKQDKIEMLRKMHSGIIQNEDDPDEGKFDAQVESTLSNYTKYAQNYIPKENSRPKTAGMLQRPASGNFRGLMPPIESNFERNQQIEELNEIKLRLAKHNVSCSVHTLDSALVSPLDLPQENLNYKNLPSPKEGLLENPFSSLLKKKGKKKKKKGKRARR